MTIFHALRLLLQALHLVLFYLLVAANLLLIPLAAMGGFLIGQLFLSHFSLQPDLAAVLSVLAAFMAIGLVNGLIALHILSAWPIQPQARRGRPTSATRPKSAASAPKVTPAAAKKAPGQPNKAAKKTPKKAAAKRTRAKTRPKLKSAPKARKTAPKAKATAKKAVKKATKTRATTSQL